MADIPYIAEIVIAEKGKPTLLKPYLVNKDANKTLAKAYLGTAQTGLASGAYVKVQLDTEVFDVKNNFYSYRYVVPVTGYYQVNFSAYLTSDGGTLTGGLSLLYKNGAETAYGVYGSALSGSLISPGSCLMNLSAGDYLELYSYGTTSSSTYKLLAGVGTSMSVQLVSTV